MSRDEFELNASNGTGHFVIHHESLDEFLAQVTDLGDTNDLAWTQQPSEAIHYTSPDQAAAVAKRIVTNMSYPLAVCEVHVQGNKARLRLVIEYKPQTNGH